MFVQRVSDSNKLHSEPMTYGVTSTVKHLQSVISRCQLDLDGMSRKLFEQEKVIQDMQTQLDEARSELSSTKHALSDVTNKLQTTKKQHDCARNKVFKITHELGETIADSMYYEEEILAKNEVLSEQVKCLQEEISSSTIIPGATSVDNSKFYFKTKGDDRVCTTAVRELYYTLLAQQMPPAKIAGTIRSVLKSFLPTIDVDAVQLPGESCASYMRRQELTTVNLAHKATCLIDKAQSGFLNLNCDGTTLSQKKMQGAAISGMVLSVNEVPDGSADSMISDISKELQKLREIAHLLHLPNADKINWTLIQSSSSDSASTQKRFNKLVEEKREEDREIFGPQSACPDVTELIENFCCMHLGVNL